MSRELEIDDGDYAVLVQEILGEGYKVFAWDSGKAAAESYAEIARSEYPDAHVLLIQLDVWHDNHYEEEAATE